MRICFESFWLNSYYMYSVVNITVYKTHNKINLSFQYLCCTAYPPPVSTPSFCSPCAGTCLHLVCELSQVGGYTDRVSSLLPLCAEAVRHRHYPHHLSLLETLLKLVSQSVSQSVSQGVKWSAGLGVEWVGQCVMIMMINIWNTIHMLILYTLLTYNTYRYA